jgi:hypothetical protein
MSPDAFDLLRAADPAVNMPEPTREDHERLRREIMATPNPVRHRRRLLPRRRFTLIAVTGALVLLGCTVAYGELRSPEPADLKPVPQPPPIDAPNSVYQSEGFLDWKQYCAEYDVWTHKITLPLGVEWHGVNPGNNIGMVSVGAGALDAVWESMGEWTREWIAATKAGDDERAARAEAWVVALRALLLTGNDESAALDRSTSNLLDSAIVEAKEAHFGKLSRMVFGYTIPWSAYEETGPQTLPTQHAGWIETLVGPRQSGLDETAMAALTSATAADTSKEYADLFKWAGLAPGDPAGAPAGAQENGRVVGDGFVAAFTDARIAWWREWVEADEAGDQERVAAASAASARLLKLLPLKAAVDPFVLTQTLDAPSMRGFELLDAQARAGDLKGIKVWLARQDADQEAGHVAAE